MTAKNRQWTTKQDGLDNLELGETAIPEPKDGEVLVKIKAVSLNYRDTEVCQGEYTHHSSLDNGQPLVPCSDMAGEIVASKSPRWQKTGARVLSIFNQTHLTGQIKESDLTSGLGSPLPGVLAQYRVFPDYALVPIPEYLKELSADTGINYRTHWEWHEFVLEATAGRGDDDEGDGGLNRLNVNVLALRRNVTLKGILNGPRDRFEEMLGFYEKKGIRPVVDKVFKFEEAKEAFKYLAEGAHFGKVVIKVAD
uniref:Enoyl reductase (ER) domain-containing protein n=1 Tax=Bionectria ochroleuca TaxID=29856 RepID=A0A0B7KLT5_BIOOC